MLREIGDKLLKLFEILIDIAFLVRSLDCGIGIFEELCVCDVEEVGETGEVESSGLFRLRIIG